MLYTYTYIYIHTYIYTIIYIYTQSYIYIHNHIYIYTYVEYPWEFLVNIWTTAIAIAEVGYNGARMVINRIYNVFFLNNGL